MWSFAGGSGSDGYTVYTIAGIVSSLLRYKINT